MLKGIGQWKVDVQFRDFGEKEKLTAFSTDQDTGNDHIRVMVNSGRKDFELNQFKAFLPKPKLPSTKETTAAKDEGMNQEFLYVHCFRKTWGMRVPSPNADKDPPTPPKALLTLRVYPDVEFELLGGESSYRLKGLVSQERNGVVKVKLEGAFGNSVHVFDGEAKLDEPFDPEVRAFASMVTPFRVAISGNRDIEPYLKKQAELDAKRLEEAIRITRENEKKQAEGTTDAGGGGDND